jgi:hypothetical protein
MSLEVTFSRFIAIATPINVCTIQQQSNFKKCVFLKILVKSSSVNSTDSIPSLYTYYFFLIAALGTKIKFSKLVFVENNSMCRMAETRCFPFKFKLSVAGWSRG